MRSPHSWFKNWFAWRVSESDNPAGVQKREALCMEAYYAGWHAALVEAAIVVKETQNNPNGEPVNG